MYLHCLHTKSVVPEKLINPAKIIVWSFKMESSYCFLCDMRGSHKGLCKGESENPPSAGWDDQARD